MRGIVHRVPNRTVCGKGTAKWVLLETMHGSPPVGLYPKKRGANGCLVAVIAVAGATALAFGGCFALVTLGQTKRNATQSRRCDAAWAKLQTVDVAKQLDDYNNALNDAEKTCSDVGSADRMQALVSARADVSARHAKLYAANAAAEAKDIEDAWNAPTPALKSAAEVRRVLTLAKASVTRADWSKAQPQVQAARDILDAVAPTVGETASWKDLDSQTSSLERTYHAQLLRARNEAIHGQFPTTVAGTGATSNLGCSLAPSDDAQFHLDCRHLIRAHYSSPDIPVVTANAVVHYDACSLKWADDFTVGSDEHSFECIFDPTAGTHVTFLK